MTRSENSKQSLAKSESPTKWVRSKSKGNHGLLKTKSLVWVARNRLVSEFFAGPTVVVMALDGNNIKSCFFLKDSILKYYVDRPNSPSAVNEKVDRVWRAEAARLRKLWHNRIIY